MQTSNHYFSAQSVSRHRQASADGLFSVVFFLLLFFKLDLLILPGNLCWILFIIVFFFFFLHKVSSGEINFPGSPFANKAFFSRTDNGKAKLML